MSSGRLEHSRSALAHAVSGRAWRQAMTVGHSDASAAASLRVGAAVAVVLIAGGLLDRPVLAAFAALGALCSAFGRHEPYPRRAGKIALTSALIVLYAIIGAVLGVATESAAIQTVVISVAAGVATLLIAAFAVTGPGAIILIFSTTAAVAFSHTAGDVVTVGVSVTAGAVVGWVASMLPALLHPVGPAQLAVARALAAVDRREQGAARAAVARARTVIALNGRILNGRAGHRSHSLALVTVLDDAEDLLDDWARGMDPTHAEEVLAHERALRKMRRYDALPVRAAALGERPRNFFSEGLTRAMSRPLLHNAARVAAASAVAAACATAFGFEHPLWAAMGAVAALQGITFHTTVARGIQRLVGNVGGAIVGAGLIAMSLGYWQTAVAIIVLQVVAELTVLRNYALTSLAITPVALLLTGLAGHLSPAVAIDRVGDTLIGVLAGIVVAALTVSAGDVAHVNGNT